MTSPAGQYVLTGLRSGPYSLAYRDCAHPGRYFPQWLGDAGPPGWSGQGPGSGRILITGGHLTPLAPVSLRPVGPAGGQRLPASHRFTIAQMRRRAPGARYGGISGRVTSASGHPIAGICVMVNFSNGWIGMPTSKNGSYNTGQTSLPQGQYTVQFAATCGPGSSSAGNWAPQWYNDKPSQATANKVVVRAGKTTRRIGAVMRRGGQITGVVTGRSGAGLTGVCVDLLTRDGQVYVAQATTRRGGYRFSGLDAGRYRVLFDPACGYRPTPYLPQWWPGAASLKTSKLVRVRLGRLTRRVDAALGLGGTITGVVRFASRTGRALAGICVFASGLGVNGDIQANATTGRNGAYVMEGLPTGRYALSFGTGCGNNGNLLYKNYPRPVRVRAGRKTSHIDAYLQPGGTISGIITSAADGKPLGGVCVSIGTIGGGTSTAKNGSFSVEQVPPGRYTVRFAGGCGNNGSYAPQYFPGQTYAADATPVTVRASQVTSGIDAAMKPGSTITGTVTSRSGRKLNGICVSAIDPGTTDAYGTMPLGGDTLSSNGSYRIANLAAGQYEIAFFSGCAFGPNYVDQWFRSQPGYTTADLVNVPAAATVGGISAVLAPAGAITGIVRNRAGTLLSLICVSATNAATGIISLAEPFFTENGRYTIDGLAPGRYTVEFSDCGGAGYATQWYDRRTTVTSADEVTVTAGHAARRIDAVLTTRAGGGTISGRVTAMATGRPLRNICVIAGSVSQASYGFAATNARGRYTIKGLASSVYQIIFAGCDGGPYVQQVRKRLVRVGIRGAVRGIDAELTLGGSISGVVLGGLPVVAQPGICVDAVPVAGAGVELGATTGRGGRYRIGQLAPGRYQVLFGAVACPGGTQGLAPQWYDNQPSQSRAATVTVTSGKNTAGIGATLLPDGSISGTVTGSAPAKAPLAGICVRAVPLAAGYNPIYAVSLGGRYSVTGVPPGEYLVEFQPGCGASGYLTQWWKNAGSRARATVVKVSANRATSGIDASMRT